MKEMQPYTHTPTYASTHATHLAERMHIKRKEEKKHCVFKMMLHSLPCEYIRVDEMDFHNIIKAMRTNVVSVYFSIYSEVLLLNFLFMSMCVCVKRETGLGEICR